VVVIEGVRRSAEGAICIALAVASSGCAFNDAATLNPGGPVALAERNLLFTAVGLILVVVIPVFVMAFWFAWRYRASKGRARYTPDWSYSARIDAVIWFVPAAIVVTLGILSWHNTHRLDPYRKLASPVSPLKVQVIAQDWKWLFIYPEQQVAVVNELAFPSGTPLSLMITSDAAMNAFYIPGLGGQIFAMAGMQTQLNLIADSPARFIGKNTQYNGPGFSKQYFNVTAMPAGDFAGWVAKVKQSPSMLDDAAYRALAKPSSAHPVTYYSKVEPGLFDKIIAKYVGGHTHVEAMSSE
jgi:cytochrome o ubiquinol oxidase subunit 2